MTPVSDAVIPNPGSLEASQRGCTCPVIDNHHGQGVPTSEGPAFWFTMGCPLHCPPVQKRRPPLIPVSDLVERLREARAVIETFLDCYDGKADSRDLHGEPEESERARENAIAAQQWLDRAFIGEEIDG